METSKREERTTRRFRVLTDAYSTNSESKIFPPICYAKGCVNPSTMFIRLPLNETVTCILKVCEKCSIKFQTNSETNKAHLAGSGSSHQVVKEYGGIIS